MKSLLLAFSACLLTQSAYADLFFCSTHLNSPYNSIDHLFIRYGKGTEQQASFGQDGELAAAKKSGAQFDDGVKATWDGALWRSDSSCCARFQHAPIDEACATQVVDMLHYGTASVPAPHFTPDLAASYAGSGPYAKGVDYSIVNSAADRILRGLTFGLAERDPVEPGDGAVCWDFAEDVMMMAQSGLDDPNLLKANQAARTKFAADEYMYGLERRRAKNYYSTWTSVNNNVPFKIPYCAIRRRRGQCARVFRSQDPGEDAVGLAPNFLVPDTAKGPCADCRTSPECVPYTAPGAQPGEKIDPYCYGFNLPNSALEEAQLPNLWHCIEVHDLAPRSLTPTTHDRKGIPAGWTCDPSKYDDGQVCDCECGVRDPDCSRSPPSPWEKANLDMQDRTSSCPDGTACAANNECVLISMPEDQIRCELGHGGCFLESKEAIGRKCEDIDPSAPDSMNAFSRILKAATDQVGRVANSLNEFNFRAHRGTPLKTRLSKQGRLSKKHK